MCTLAKHCGTASTKLSKDSGTAYVEFEVAVANLSNVWSRKVVYR